MWLPMSYSTCQCINIYNIYYIYNIYIYIYISLHSHLETDSTVTAIQQWDKIRSYLPADVCTRWKHHVQSWIQGGTHHKDKDSNSCFSTAPEPKQWRLEVVQCCQLAHWRSFCLLLFLLSWQNRICILSQHHTSHMKMVQCVRHDIMNAQKKQQKNNVSTQYRHHTIIYWTILIYPAATFPAWQMVPCLWPSSLDRPATDPGLCPKPPESEVSGSNISNHGHGQLRIWGMGPEWTGMDRMGWVRSKKSR